MQRSSLLTSCFLFLAINLQAQFSVGKMELNQIIPPSPEAASLGKYGQIPVSLSTGKINIQIPFYSVKSRKLETSVGLSYSSGGIKVEEMSSTVGLGWVLNAGGIITRTVVGLPDDQSGDGTTTGGYLINHNANVNRSASTFTNNETDVNFLRDVATTKIIDPEPDIFFYNFGPYSGKFVFDDQKKASTIPYSNLKFEPNVNAASGIQSFKATDDKGVIYEFDDVVYTDAFYKQYEENSNNYNLLSQTEIFSGPSSWYLTRMISPDLSDTIRFIYDDSYSNLRTSIKDFYAEEGYKMNPADPTGDPIEAMTYGRYPHSEQSSTSGVKLIKQIIFNNGKIEFDYAFDRQDVSNAYTTVSDGYHMGRLTSASLFNVDNAGIYTLLKKMTLNQTYFESDGIGNKSQKYYRLKLNEVIENDKNNITIGEYKLEYDEITKLPQRDSYAQDFWGYYNGQGNNTGMLQSRLINSVIHPTWTYNIGNAIRDPSAAYMNAYNLKRIYYPTGGFSEFTFEPNVYESVETSIQSKSETIQVVTGTSAPTASLSFLNTSPLHTGSVIFSVSKYSDKIADRSPYGYIYDVNTGISAAVYFESTDSTQNYTVTVPYVFDMNHTYQIYIYTHADNPAGVTVSLTAIHNTVSTASTLKMMGGLRISKIEHYDNNTAVLEEIYKYGIDENGAGKPLIDEQVLTIFTKPIYYKFLHSDEDDYGSCYETTKSGNQYYTNPVVSLSDLNGSLIGYEQVTKYTVNPKNESSTNGKEIFYYNILQDHADEVYNAPGYYIVDSKPWRNGLQSGKADVSEKGNSKISSMDFNIIKENTASILKVSEKYKVFGSCTINTNRNTDYIYYNYPLSTGIMLPTKETTTFWESGNSSITTTKEFEYSNLTHFQPTLIKEISSKGEPINTVLKYPSDVINDGEDYTGVYGKMVNKNIITPVITDIVSKNGIQLIKEETNYRDWFSNNMYLFPETITKQIRNNNSEPRILFNQYDLKGNIIEQQKTNDILHSYLWDYNSTYPVAEVTNSTQSDIAYTSFEADGKGNWTFSGTAGTTGGTITGDKYYSSASPVTKAGLTSTKKYIISYWQKGGSVTITGGTQSNAQTGKTIDGWTYKEVTVTGTTNVSISNSGGYLDELRLHPSDAQMTTYTYAPLIGTTSETDPNGRTIYYEYDGFGRLVLIRDQDRNIIKKICYNYAGQPGACDIIYVNDLHTQTFTATSCDANHHPEGPVVYTVPAGTYTSGISKADANQKAQQDIDMNGQNYANTHVVCISNSLYAKLTIENQVGNQGDVVIRFYNDEACTQLTPANNLMVSLNEDEVNDYYGNTNTNTYNILCNGYEVVALSSVILIEDTNDEVQSKIYRFYSLNFGDGYIPAY